MPLSSLLRAFKSKDAQDPAARLRIAVVGGGRIGQFHLKHLSRNPSALLAGVADTDEGRRKALAQKYKITAYPDPSELIGKIDAVIIATPTPSHYDIGRQFLEAGISCLIEKPLASTLEEAEALISLASSKGCVLQVGHIERFNPAVIEATKHIEHPQFIEVNRLGPYDPRVAGIGVVMDLMIHDLDIVLFLVGEDVTRVEAFGAQVLSNHEDIAKVRLHFKGGCIADLSASRISLKKYRRIRIFQKNAYLSLDYAAPKLQVYKKKTDVVKSLGDISMLSPKLSKKDPLALEQTHFIECVREKRRPLVSGEHGRDALKLAQEILRQLKVHA
jgi:predicted dehydrogenase